MKSTIAALGLVLLMAEVAHADRILTPPAGWVEDATHATVVKGHMQTEVPSGVEGSVEVYSYRPEERGAQLIASSMAVKLSGEAIEQWVRERIDGLRETPAVMAGDDGEVRTVSWTEKGGGGGKWMEAALEWADEDNGMLSMVRAVWIHRTGAEAIEEYRAECLMTSDVAATVRPVCEKAMAGITLPAAKDLMPITAAVAVGEGDDEEEPESGTGTGTGTGTGAVGATARPTPPDLEPIEPQQPTPKSSGTDTRPFWVAGGLLVLVAALLWSQKKRKELLAEEERAREAEAAEAKARKAKADEAKNKEAAAEVEEDKAEAKEDSVEAKDESVDEKQDAAEAKDVVDDKKDAVEAKKDAVGETKDAND